MSDIRSQIEALGGSRQTIETLAAATGLSVGVVSRRLRGDRQLEAGEKPSEASWSADEVIAAARAAGVNPIRLLTARGVLRPGELLLAVAEMNISAEEIAAEIRPAPAAEEGYISLETLRFIADAGSGGTLNDLLNPRSRGEGGV